MEMCCRVVCIFIFLWGLLGVDGQHRSTPIGYDAGLDLFDGVEQTSAKNSAWKFRSKTPPVIVHKENHNDVLHDMNSFSVELKVKINRKLSMSVFRITNNSNILFDVILDQSNISINFINNHGEKEVINFLWTRPLFKKWANFVVSIHNGRSKTMSLWDFTHTPQTNAIPNGISNLSLQYLNLEVAGKSTNARIAYSGLISKGYIHVPAVEIPLDTGLKERGLLKKSSALRKPSSSSDTSDGLTQHAIVTRVDRQANRQIDQILLDLRNQITECKNENLQMKNMMSMIKGIQTTLEDRVATLERCECTPVCIASDGMKKAHDESWEEGRCTRCVCSHGQIQCHNITACQTLSPCESNPCQNYGECVDGQDGFTCRCRAGFIGHLCETTDQCYRVNCMNGGECRQRAGRFYCMCRHGFIGQHCESVDYCSRNPCHNGAQCVNERDTYRCVCAAGFTGQDCRYEDGCSSQPCVNGGVCESTLGDIREYTCACTSEYTGRNCELINHCSSQPCFNGGQCTNTGISFRCQCHHGFVGDVCDQVDHCSAQPCMNGASCSNVGDGFQCHCTNNYHGRLCERQDACSSSPCLNGGSCVDDGRGEYSCVCTNLYYGERCQLTNHCSSQPCLNGGTCQNTMDGFICRCRRTHYGDLCESSNYCRARPCMNGATCTNVPLNPRQPFTCTCIAGYVGNVCQRQDFCQPNPCLNGAECSVQDTTYECICVQPYMGRRCESIDYCSRNPCLNGGRCRNDDRGFQCSCPRQYFGRRCENGHPCRNNPCLNGGVCAANGRRSYTCTCPETHYGPDCQSINHCTRNPCLNGGSCVNQEGGSICLCRDNFSGPDCSVERSCRNNPCLNGGTCVDGVNITCICPSSHRGERCEHRCNICLLLPHAGVECAGGGVETSQRWYFDKFTQTCKPIQYKGCGGNANIFDTRQACRQRCIVGSCCMLRISSSGRVTNMCKIKSLSQCKRLNVGRRDVQVIGFQSGQECSETSCGMPETCTVGLNKYMVGSSIDVGCNRSCVCRSSGILDCPCTETIVRRELRSFTSDEISRYQNAIRTLKTTELPGGVNIWDSFRDEYMFRAPLAQSSLYFLLWNRAFLRKMEMVLQRVDCHITIPYYDFTIDAGLMNESIAWQPNYFGGDGECVPDHPFRFIQNHQAEPWEPCLVRDFNSSVTIPNMVDVAMAISTSNINQLGSNLLNIVSYVKAYIGGDMATTSCAYDPLFYSLHAYVDHLFSQWQQKHQDVSMPTYTHSIQLGLSPELIWMGACVSYVDARYHVPCNRTSTSDELFADDGYNLQGYDREGFNRRGFAKDGYNALGVDIHGRHDTRSIFIYDGYNAHGYNRSGFDRRGYNKFGFCQGYDRDGFNEAGFDKTGYNRYGLDSLGYDSHGFSIYGVSMDGELDTSEFYNEETGLSDCCFSRDGFTVAGVDRFGFTAARRDHSQCDYFFNGPHALYYQQQLWNILSRQPQSFLLSLQRTCGSLSPQPSMHIINSWLTRSSSLLKLPHYHPINTTFCQRMCLDVDMLMTWCPCLEGEYPAVCHTNPCENAFCPLHPTARCHINFCGRSCSSEFYLNGRRVNCDEPCDPNPCLNGGTCIPSRYPSQAESFTCQCLNEYSGSLCERPAPDTCVLPRHVGRCQESMRRWYYNQATGACEEFQYTGCGGNANNFPNQKACNLRCSVGACCYRAVRNANLTIGFDSDGYDKYGFNDRGYDRQGQLHSSHNSIPFGNQVLGAKGFGPDGFNIYGYNERGCDRQGYNQRGYHCVSGYNRDGYNKDGEFDQLIGYNQNGLNTDGFNRDGFRCNGLNEDGFNRLGFYKEYVYNCHSMSLFECGGMRLDHEVIRFSPGKSCDQVDCGDKCGCVYNDKLYKFGETFEEGCQQCTCTPAGSVDCVCQNLGKRKEIRDLTQKERNDYATAVRKLYESGQWDFYVNLHSEYFPHANGGPASLPWHRYFLKLVEREMQNQMNCNIFIPYFDWTIDVGSLNTSTLWSAEYFGGNGEPETNCVLDHPFDSTESWHPCIRRRFNSSMILPSIVDIQILLHEPNYDDFRIQLEMMSSLFHVWVGGHMTSPFSPYDPVFLSHWAFMDNIWTQWQKKDPNGVSRFPSTYRYTQLKPFDISPDDILISQQQTCVNYIPPTLGSPCNATSLTPSLRRNTHGFDRHGYDENGYDIMGYNRDGYNANGRLDKRGSYNEAGFSADGYQRSGFDSQGWDQFGFNSNNFNKDGIDIEGFDKSGYDQYGFDRSGRTPYGMFQNETYDLGVDVGRVASLFDQYGYNRFGFDNQGLDHNGFNAFGFDLHGFDQDNCNFYQSGPHYMRFYFFSLMQLKQMQRNTLRQIKRICEPISDLPQWIAMDWLHDLPRVHRFQQVWRSNTPLDRDWTERTSSVTDDQLWFPITPDKQFCFNLQWNSGCPLGSPLLDCDEDLCSQSHCASHPHAMCRVMNCGSCYPEFYDGSSGEVFQCYGCIDMQNNVHMEASTWENDCNVCTCQSGMISCNVKMCPHTSCSHPSAPTSSCCPVCQDCEYEGEVYRNGQQFEPNDCENCVCVSGSVTCRSVATNCPQVTCINPVMKPGDCCLSCPRSCEGHRERDEWSMGRCHNCKCKRGLMQCNKARCPVAQCSHPFKPSTECCPVCRDCSFNGRVLRNGQNFMNDSCSQCTCAFGNVECVTQQCPSLSCINKRTIPGSCCPVCDIGCSYQRQLYRNGETFHPNNDLCYTCTCLNNDVKCSEPSCPNIDCPNPIHVSGQCCPQCNECSYNNQIYRNLQVWTSTNGCKRCICQQGNVQCSSIQACQQVCTHGVKIEGQCCDECVSCYRNGRTYANGERFTNRRDVCKQCVCQEGNITCNQISCPTLRCVHQYHPSNECCPKCRSCMDRSQEREHDSSWQLHSDPCITCTCQQGKITCAGRECPHVDCEFPATPVGQCCRSCDGCFYQGISYRDGDVLITENNCQRCTCTRGDIVCLQSCPVVSCASPHTREGECCPSCISCEYDGEVYEEGSTFLAPRNPCMQCYCQSGETSCDRIDGQCPKTECSHPGRSVGQCCPACDACEYERRSYRDGEQFTPVGSSSCFTCICNRGSVACSTIECPEIRCSNPVSVPTRCCPVCLTCQHAGNIYDDGEKWYPDACTSCSCNRGASECVNSHCIEAGCSHPVELPGKCCGTCDACQLNGRIISSPSTFQHPDEPCQVCNCQSGNITCQPRECEQLSCSSPIHVNGSCCPSCPQHCVLGGQVQVENGQSILHPDDNCMMCSCQDGDINCQGLCNLSPECSHPTDGACCRDNCDGCRYRGREYRNGEVFNHAHDRCRSCTCTNGNVRCHTKRCKPVTCENLIQSRGECCRTCPDVYCQYNGTTHADQETFMDGCKRCECLSGEVSCRQRPCPVVRCRHPLRVDCCRSCEGCHINGANYQNGDVVTDSSSNACEVCQCLNGNLHCSEKTCPPTECTHPSVKGCCPACEGCMYNSVSYHDGTVFESFENACELCSCNHGNVVCERVVCPQSTCTHPDTTTDSCCPVCGGRCQFNDGLYEDGEIFTSHDDECMSCTCLKGTVSCEAKRCNEVSCSNPSSGICGCPTCVDCFYNEVIRRNRERFSNPEDERCSECYCHNGNVVCGRKQCPASTCTHPALDVCGCPLCQSCRFNNQLFNNEDEFNDPENTCNTCLCEDGNVRCSSRTCTEVNCQNPTFDKCGCPVCFNCNYMGVDYTNNERFTDSMNQCNQCVCTLGTVQCIHVPCPPAPCPSPVVAPGECCSKCIETCDVGGAIHDNGAIFPSADDPCSTCSCSFGTVRCLKFGCDRSCTHPRAQSECCPDCSGCLYQGVLRNEGEFFTPTNQCKQCSCYRGSVLCRDIRCPVVECSDPQTPDDKCCPECPEALTNVCVFHNRLHDVGSRWLHRSDGGCGECLCDNLGAVQCTSPACDTECTHSVPSLQRCCGTCNDCFYQNQTWSNRERFQPNSCQECVCTDGNVHCVTKACRPLSCALEYQVHQDDNCCPYCASCSALGHLFIEDEVWYSPSDSCLQCTCHNGVVTCNHVTCIDGCHSSVTIPGQCCPVCSGCMFNNQAHEVGSTFEINPMDPCEICECSHLLSNTTPSYTCQRVVCPSLADCPRSCIQQPQPGTCCPTCSNHGHCNYGNCVLSNRGQIITPFDNMCMTCECNNNTWLCSPVSCSPLSCAHADQYTPKGSCCPVCDSCHLEAENREIASGLSWRVDECRSCECNQGSIVCVDEQCPQVNCPRGMLVYKQTGDCCDQCVDPMEGCVYDGHTVAPQHRWLVDKCTSCRCFAGRVDCVTQRCRMLMCDSDEVASVIPGECCPRCIPQPANCVAFGDPHYRTFDGRMIHFQGTCRYLLTADCSRADFRIEVENNNIGSDSRVSWTNRVFLTVAKHKLILDNNYNVILNGTRVPHLPFLIQHHVFIDKSGNNLLINTHLGVRLSWNALQRHLEVDVPSNYKKKLCGLCGNFNNIPQDDLRLRNSRISRSDVAFGNNWKVLGRNMQACPDATEYNPCDVISYSKRKRANDACKVINSDVFTECHQVVNPAMYFSSCVHDVCACGSNDQYCVCDVLEAYAAECRRSGVVMSWRSRHLCAVGCPEERGYVFDECGSPCKRTCANKNLPPGVIEDQCFMPCVSGCQCPAGKVEYDGHCINPLDCPSNIASSEVPAFNGGHTIPQV